jgi:hypothetical protein
MKNIHVRELPAPIERVRPWIEAAWSATRSDPFPRDVIRNWRRNPPGGDPLALVPGVTRVGHGPFSFRFEKWDGARWRVRVENDGYPGWHGFDLEPSRQGCRLTHTIELRLSPVKQLVWLTCFAAIHDWAVEATFDRLGEALRTGEMPASTVRPMPRAVSLRFAALRILR